MSELAQNAGIWHNWYMLNAKNCLNCKRLQILQPIFSAWNFTINWTFYFIYMIKSASWCWPMLIKSGEMKDRYFMYWSSLLLIGLPINKARGSLKFDVCSIFCTVSLGDSCRCSGLTPFLVWFSNPLAAGSQVGPCGSLWSGPPSSLNQCCP